jgi:hypothetical protein
MRKKTIIFYRKTHISELFEIQNTFKNQEEKFEV